MSGVELSKKYMSFLYILFIVVFVVFSFNLLLSNYRVGSGIDVKWEDRELVILRTLKCLENNEDLNICLKTNKYMIKAVKNGEESGFVNREIYNKFESENKLGDLFTPLPKEFFVLEDKYEITVWFEK